MQEQKRTIETHIAQAERAEWKRPRICRLEAYDAEATRGGLGVDAIYS